MWLCIRAVNQGKAARYPARRASRVACVLHYGQTGFRTFEQRKMHNIRHRHSVLWQSGQFGMVVRLRIGHGTPWSEWNDIVP